jgi:hypothetical protein
MDTTQQGTAQQAAQTGPTGEQQAAQQTQATQAAQQTQAADTTQQAQASPQAEELQRQLTELKEQNRIANESQRHWQSQADRFKAQAQGLLGVQPQADPLAEDVKFWLQRGYPEKEARDMVEFTHQKLSGIQQQNQQLQQTIQATTAVGQAFQMAAGDKDYGALFGDPEIANQVHQELQRCALGGQGNFVTPEYAKEIAALAYTHKSKPWLAQTGTAIQPTQQVQQRQPSPIFNFMGPQGANYAPAIQTAKPVNPAVQAVGQDILSHFGIKKP